MRSKEALQIRILNLCDENELSLNALGARCGITQSTLNNIVNGRNNSITIQTVLRICRGLGMELQEFFDDDLFRDIEQEADKGNADCAVALDKFAYEVRKYIGAYAAALGGLDCLVFTAGVGENSASMRARICEGLEFLGVKLDPEKNNTRGKEAIISADDSKVTVWVIPTNEELMIAQDTAALVNAAK